MKSKIQSEIVRKFKPKQSIVSYDDSKPILYALGIGFNSDPMKEEDFKFTYELADGFTTFPTFSTVVGKFSTFDDIDECGGFPKFNKMQLLHGEQSTRIINPIPTSATVLIKRKFEDIQDKGKGALLIASSTICDAQNPSKIYSEDVGRYFLRGLGGFGDKGTYPSLKFPKIPQDREPDKIVEQKVREDQAILYRLSGDRNPLHIDPKMAAQGGFNKPILHGLCFYGISARSVFESFCKGEVENFRSISARFTAIVFPGDTLIVKMYKLGGGKILVHTSTKERGKIVLMAVAEVKEESSPKL